MPATRAATGTTAHIAAAREGREADAGAAADISIGDAEATEVRGAATNADPRLQRRLGSSGDHDA